ncbi:MAG: DUF4340 domain-containing protein [Spirulinaceae cyanobacterium]
MKLQRTTLALLISAIALSGIVYVVEATYQTRRSQQARQQKQIFAFGIEEITGLTIAVDEELLVFERDRSQPETEQWQMKAPETGTADPATIEFLTDLLVEGERERTFLIDAEDRETYGLEEPFATITIELADADEPEVLQLGGPNFDNKLLYAQLNPETQPETDQTIVVVPIELQYAVEREIPEWLTLAEQEEESDREAGEIEEDDTEEGDTEAGE